MVCFESNFNKKKLFFMFPLKCLDNVCVCVCAISQYMYCILVNKLMFCVVLSLPCFCTDHHHKS